ncbi:MAG: hypothetical protein HN348_23505, partial [Proteobacteria bacterium]|nr:hypothetical protein [Pseudomonadota bacterium]
MNDEDAGRGGETLTWCTLPDGRKHGPELFFYADGFRREYTEYAVGLEQGLCLITDSQHEMRRFHERGCQALA